MKLSQKISSIVTKGMNSDGGVVRAVYMTGAFVYYLLVDPKPEEPMRAPPKSGDGIKLINF